MFQKRRGNHLEEIEILFQSRGRVQPGELEIEYEELLMDGH